MKSRNKNATPQIENAVSRAVNFEVSIADLARRSERRAWLVAMSAVLMSLILAGGYFYMLPLKQKVPYLVMADAYTGTATVARLREDFNDPFITTSEAVNRSNVAHFVIARESYDIALMNLRDWTTVYTMSSPEVAAGYTNLHSDTNSSSPFRIYGKDKSIRIKILSIVLIGGTADTSAKGATVRFQRVIYNKQNGSVEPLDSKLATLEFIYKPNLKMDEKHRIENPLGFYVTSYRVDNDYATSPPLANEAIPTAPGVQDIPPTMQPQAPSGVVMPSPSEIQNTGSGEAAAMPNAPPSPVPALEVPAPAVPTHGPDNR